MSVSILKEFRENHNISREDQAKMLGISIDTLNTWEYRTKHIPNIKIRYVESVFEKYEKEKELSENTNQPLENNYFTNIFSKKEVEHLTIDKKLSTIIDQNILLNTKLDNLSLGMSKVFLKNEIE